MSKSIKIVIADDHPIVLQGFRKIIEADPHLIVVAEAHDGDDALRLIGELQPQVAVLDIDMPGLDGFAVVRKLQGNAAAPEIILLTMHSEEELFHAAMDLGIKGYVLKDSAVGDIVAAIKAVANGQPFLSPSLSALLLKRRRQLETLALEHPGLHLLTLTERRILKMIAEDKTSQEIGKTLYISRRTVDTHRANIGRKLDLRGALGLIKFAAAHKSEL